MNVIKIADIAINQDIDGRYCLNDLHKAAGGEARHKPGNWMMLEQTKAFIAEIEGSGIAAIFTKQGIGTFVVKELVYSYAMWISPSFNLKVIRAYDDMKSAVAVMSLEQMTLEVIRGQQQKIVEMEKQALLDAPKIKFATIVSDDSNVRCIRVWVKAMKSENNLMVGEQEVFKWLLNEKFIFKSVSGYLPYSKYEPNGLNYFRIILDEKNGHVIRQIAITGKGVVALTSKIVSHFKSMSE